MSDLIDRLRHHVVPAVPVPFDSQGEIEPDGLVVWLRHMHEMGELDERGGLVRFLDLVDRARGVV